MVASLLRRMHWLQTEENGTYSLQSLQLDIVGFLAILGEGSVLANAQVSTLSKWIFLPRLIPAPQALMRPTRPLDLEPAKGDVSGVLSGNDRDHINYIGNIICDANNLPKHSVRIVEIKRTDDRPIKSQPFGPLTFVAWLGFVLSAMLLGLSIHLRDGMSIMATALLSLLSSLIGLGNFWTLKLPMRKIQDHRSKNDTFHVKSQTSQIAREEDNNIQPNDITCEGAYETSATEIPPTDSGDHVPDGDVVIRYPKGNFLVIRCHENVARELYFAPEEIEYMVEDAWIYRLLSLVGTMMLMGGVICLANARIESQIAWAGSYMLLGAAYWIVAALPAKVHWDTSCYEVKSEALSGHETREKRNFFTSGKKDYPFSSSTTFTDALWKAIVASKETGWVRRGNHCPNTKVWDEWLLEAKDKAGTCGGDFGLVKDEDKKEGEKDIKRIWKVPEWDAQHHLLQLFKENKAKKEEV